MEMALVTPLLIMLALLMIEGGRIARTHQVLNNAAREGARLSTNQDFRNRQGDIADQVVAYAAANNVTVTSSDVNVEQCVVFALTSTTSAYASRVTVARNFQSMYSAAFSWLGLPTTFVLRGRAQFRNFYGC